MLVICARKFAARHTAAPAVLAALAFISLAAPYAQGQNPSSATNPYYGSITVEPVTSEPLRLSLDQAVAMGLKNNLGLKEAENNEKQLRGEKNEALQEFLPTLILSGSTGVSV